MPRLGAGTRVCPGPRRGYAPVDVADDRSRDGDDDTDGTGHDEALDTAALLDQGEQLLADSARLLRRLDAALANRRRDADRDGDARDGR